MEAFINYHIKSVILLGIFYGVYVIFLAPKTHFRLNRMYLIYALTASLILPLVHFPTGVVHTGSDITVFLQSITVSAHEQPAGVGQVFSLNNMIIIIYLAGVLFFALRFGMRLLKILQTVRKYGIVKKGNKNFVFIKDVHLPFSFFNLIFISNELSPGDAEKIIKHESVHVDQKHSADIIFIELISIIQWFNPFVGVIRQSLKNVHEYLADSVVLSSGFEKNEYQQLILDTSFSTLSTVLSNNFNTSQIKKRIIMMTKTKTGFYERLRFWIIAPIFTILAVLFMCSYASSINPTVAGMRIGGTTIKPDTLEKANNTVTKDGEIIYEIVEEMPAFGEKQEDLISYISKNVVYPQQAKEEGIKGNVFVSFIITKTGKVTDVSVVKSAHPSLDAEATRVISGMPNWKPGKQKGKAVAVKVVLPIKFALS